MVTFVPSSNKANIASYKATTAGQSCTVAADQSPLQCTINGLRGSAVYTVQAVACLPNGDCSSPIFGQAITLLDGALIISHNVMLQIKFKTVFFA